ncbi:MAG: GGDEF domain-containing protein [Caldimonas sp.]
MSNMTQAVPLAKPVEQTKAQIAKAALRRLATERLEPTPENYERAYRLEAGEPPEPTDSLATLIERLLRGVERGGRGWTPARRRDGVQRVLAGTRSDPRRLQHRLNQLLSSWDGDVESASIETSGVEEPSAELAPPPAVVALVPAPPAGDPPVDPATALATAAAERARTDAALWQRSARILAETLQQALPDREGANRELVGEIDQLLESARSDGAPESLADDTDAVARRAHRVLQHRHHLFEQLGKLCLELTSSLTDLAEDGSWVKGQCEAMRVKIEEGLSARGVRAVSDMLHHARKQHAEVRSEREKARDALKALITQMLAELAELGSKTGNFHESVGRYAEVIEGADTLEGLTGVVREMVAESRAVQTLVARTQERLQEEHGKATNLSERIVQLEDEMKRLSDEVSTDQLTQVANRRGLMQAFEIERARLERDGGELSIGLLDIDNFKRLNDELGHSAGDEALKSLAAIVSKTLRPTDHVARYGGEEFVVLLPQTPAAEGEQVLTRLQRALTGGLFMHKDKQVFVTFSAGVTRYRSDERIEESLERADQALYEAKRTGKNRTCIG